MTTLNGKQREVLMDVEAKPKAQRFKNQTVEKYATVHIPKILAELIDELVASGEFGYSSRAEFIKDIIRTSLKEYGYYPRTHGGPLQKTAEDKS